MPRPPELPVAPTPAWALWPDNAQTIDPGSVSDDLGADQILTAAQSAGCRWTDVRVHGSLGSTNAVAMALAAQECSTGTVVVADQQTAGRGRLDRTWVAPAGTAALFSVVLSPSPGEHGFGALPLVCGVAIAEAIHAVAGVQVGLKWPNDVLVRASAAPAWGKAVGILAQRDPVSGSAVLGVGINVSNTELPVPTATSLRLAGARNVSRAVLIGTAMARLAHWFERWDTAGTATDELLEEYRRRCLSIGLQVRVTRQGAEELVGTCVGIAPDGALLLDCDGYLVDVVVGDVIHATIS